MGTNKSNFFKWFGFMKIRNNFVRISDHIVNTIFIGAFRKGTSFSFKGQIIFVDKSAEAWIFHLPIITSP
ncbi:MAG: hypothetical protein A2822_03310 [Candidatus Staskawiczbacteria bacterium RIFCSPHIGHO2_01_FULL_41_41]|uniref:Uncharacterized protein n=1 Tax=Candidatus Staskawiczbacteria bacterium RIFCSPHIGHO2_01_FULL_41_41 TaxID=1802203 RepID=A0A1G2HT82_9BACT|nr:MAG: hypothetical protein A2822_03310 [Candidatus Staskawiczbacteria bacterium RIFCSPHIGHO2_01_FULL_41_41]